MWSSRGYKQNQGDHISSASAIWKASYSWESSSAVVPGAKSLCEGFNWKRYWQLELAFSEFWVPGWVLHGIWSLYSPPQPSELGTIIHYYPHQTDKETEAHKGFHACPGDTASRWQSWDSNPGRSNQDPKWEDQYPGLFVSNKEGLQCWQSVYGQEWVEENLRRGWRRKTWNDYVCKETGSYQETRTFQAELGCPLCANYAQCQSSRDQRDFPSLLKIQSPESHGLVGCPGEAPRRLLLASGHRIG